MHPNNLMDPASKELWVSLRDKWLETYVPIVVKGMTFNLLWLAAGLVFGKPGLLSLVLVLAVVFLVPGVVYTFKEVPEEVFVPAWYLLSPLNTGAILGFYLANWLAKRNPVLPTILTGKGIASFTREGVDKQDYRVTMTDGRSTVLAVSKSYHPGAYVIRVGHNSFVLGSLEQVLGNIDDGLRAPAETAR
jgi:hypothetical protein